MRLFLIKKLKCSFAKDDHFNRHCEFLCYSDETMATKDPSKQDPKIGGDASDSASCDASDENSSVGNRSSDESEDGDDVNETIRESDVANPHPGIDGNKEVEIIEFWDQVFKFECYLLS